MNKRVYSILAVCFLAWAACFVIARKTQGTMTYIDDIWADFAYSRVTIKKVSNLGLVKGIATGKTWYVAPNGKTPSQGGDGSLQNPWTLRTALNDPPGVSGGDIIYVRGGEYTAPGLPAERLSGEDDGYPFPAHLVGTSDQSPIVIKPYPGERATVLGGIAVKNGTKFVWFWGLELSGKTGQGNRELRPKGFDILNGATGEGIRVVNNIIHDNSQGVGFWEGCVNCEVYGNLIYYNGWPASDRGHGHGTYTQNKEPSRKILKDNLIFQQYGFGTQVYGTSNAWVQGVDVIGNVFANNGEPWGETKLSNLFIGGAQGKPKTNLVIKENMTYEGPTDSGSLYSGSGTTGDNAIGGQWDWDGLSTDAQRLNTNVHAVVENNYFVGGASAVQVSFWNSIVFRNNVTYSWSGSQYHPQVRLRRGVNGVSGYDWDNNKYYGLDYFWEGYCTNSTSCAGTGRTFATWKANTGLDTNSTFSPSRPSEAWVFVRPNSYESGRGNIVVYNWPKSSAVQVNLSGVVPVGGQYEIRDAQNFFGNPITSGTYNGGTIMLSMTSTALAPMIGGTTRIKHMAPEFGMFVVLTAGSAPISVPFQPTTPTSPPAPTPPVPAATSTPSSPSATSTPQTPGTPVSQSGTNFAQYFEAEDAQIASPMTTLSESAASGGKYVTSSASENGAVTFTFQITEAGTYRLWGRVLAPASNRDSFYVKMDNGSEDIYDVAEGTWSNSWQWTKVNGRNGGNPLTLNPRVFNLSSGSHTVTFRTRDSNSALDKIFITNSASAIPGDSGLPAADTTPPVISNIQITSITSSSTLVSWTTNEPATSRIEYGLNGSLTRSTTGGLTTAHSVKLQGLARKTAYALKIYVTDASGNTASSNLQAVTTAPRLNRMPSVRSVTASKGSIVLNWQQPVDDEGIPYELYGGTIIMKSTTGFVSVPDISAKLADVKNPNFTFTDIAVENNMTYYYSLFAYDDQGVFAAPINISFTPGVDISAVPAAPAPAGGSGGGSGTSSGGGSSGDGSSASTSSPQGSDSQSAIGPSVPESGTKLINNNGTLYVISGNSRRGVTNPGMLYSYGFEFKDAVPATPSDLAFAEGALLLPANGALVKSASNPTVYLISNSTRRAFTSSKVFSALGFKFSSVLVVTDPELSALPLGEIISTASIAHPEGVDVVYGSTVYWINGGARHAYPNIQVYNSWHRDNDFSQVLPANQYDMTLPEGEMVLERK